MSATKYTLTRHADKFNAGAGRDLFFGPLQNGVATLDSDDFLNGGVGQDIVQATLLDGTIAPTLEKVERGIFTTGKITDAHLDLAHAADMSGISFLQNAIPQDMSKITIDHATNIHSISLKDVTNNAYVLTGLDTAHNDRMDIRFDTSRNDSVELDNASGEAFKTMTVTLTGGSNVGMGGSSATATSLKVYSLGPRVNSLYFDEPTGKDQIEHIEAIGNRRLRLASMSDAYMHLKSFDSSFMTATTVAQIGGEHLRTVLGSDHSDLIFVGAMGGTETKPATVDLAGGNDQLNIGFTYDPKLQHFDGGAGTDVLTLNGKAELLNETAVNFESVKVYNATGIYDVAGMNLSRFVIEFPATAATVDHLASGATLSIATNATTFLTVNVAGASGATSDALTLSLASSVNLGGAVGGLSAPDLSHLAIDTTASDHVMYLTTIGSATDAASIEINGNHKLELHASNASTSYIGKIVSHSGEGVDISGLADGNHAFIDSGATIQGGAGDDILVGGDGADHISTGGGSNTVIGSLGADTVTLLQNGAQDFLVFNLQADASFGSAHDKVENFGLSDIVDIAAIAAGTTLAGNFVDNNGGIASLSSSHASAFFNTTSHTLYIDLNHDKQLDAMHDMQIQLQGLDTFQTTNLIS